MNQEPKYTTEAICTVSVRDGTKTIKVEVLVQRVFPGGNRLAQYAIDGNQIPSSVSCDRYGTPSR